MRFFKKKLIEYYDAKKDPIKIYFIEKIQILVSLFNKKNNSAKKLIKKKKSNNNILPLKFLKENKNGKKIYEIRKVLKKKELVRKTKIKDENDNKNVLKKNLEKYKIKERMNSSIIKQQLDKQMSYIDKKLLKRREKSWNKSKNNSLTLTTSKNHIDKSIGLKTESRNRKSKFIQNFENFLNAV